MISDISRASSFLVKKICQKSISVDIVHEKKFGLIGKLLNIRNEVITFSFNGQKAKAETKSLFSLIDRAIEGSKKTEWFKEETVTLLSSEVNKVIDAASEKYGKVINEKDKKNIFHKISSEFSPLKLDPRCTQSSISQILYNSNYLSERMEKLSVFSQSHDEKNKLRNMVNSKLTDLIFMKKFGGIDLNLLRQKTAEEVALRIRLKKL